MTIKILDYSWARPDPDDIVAYPAIGVMRYLGPGNNGRDITPDEMRRLQDAGLGVGLVYETTANRALSGYSGGCHDGDDADRWAEKLGWPNLPIYFACDCDVSTTQAWGAVCDYFAGTMTCEWESRTYGEADVIDAVYTELGMVKGWQPAATAWSGGRVSTHAAMWQRWPYVLDNTCDENDVLCPSDEIDWLYGGTNMPLSATDLNAIKQVVETTVNTAMAKNYTGNRALQVDGRDEVWELVTANGELCARYICRTDQQRLLQWADHLAGERGDPPRKITDPADIREFDALPKIGRPA